MAVQDLGEGSLIDRDYLVDVLLRLMREPTNVPLGSDTMLEPDEPRLVHYVQDVVRPELIRHGVHDLIDAGRNNLIGRLGHGHTARSLLLMVYTVTQHHNLMSDAYPGRIANGGDFGFDEPCAFGQGVSQNKGHQAVLLSVLKCLRDRRVSLGGRLYCGFNNEGRSSHACTRLILSALPQRPQAAVLLTKTELGIQLGNRGRVDVIVSVRGKATHSSRPQAGLSAIDGANEVINRLKTLDLASRGQHPLLGGRNAVLYQVTYAPMAPHTLPETARLLIDRRLLPGDDPDAAADEVRACLGDMQPYDVTVERGVFMLPSLTERDAMIVGELQAAHKATLGEEARTFYGGGTYDLGGVTSSGIPAVMFGASGGDWPLGTDCVPLSHLVNEAEVVARLVLDTLC